MHRFLLLPLLAACASNTQVPLDPTPMMESLRISNQSEECVEEAVYECIEEGGACETSYGDWVTCVFDNDCVDDDGFLDEFCAEVCDDQAELFQTCMWDDCAAFDACETPEDADSEAQGEAPNPGQCDAELSACTDEADGACAPVMANWQTCAQEAGCTDEDGVADSVCAQAACPTDTGAVNECIYQECDAFLTCIIDTESNTGDACYDASTECFFDDCSDAYGSYLGCIFANQCVDEHGFLDEFCDQENCSTENMAVGTCISSSCPDYVDACH